MGTSVHLLLPPPGYWHTSFFFLAGPGHLHESAVSAFSRSPMGRANTFSFLFLLSISRIPLKCFSDPTLFRSVSLYSASALYFPNFQADITSSRFPPMYTSFHTFSTTLSHHIPACPFVTFSLTALSTMAGNLFFGSSGGGQDHT